MSTWLDHYRSNKDATWIKCQTSDGEWHYFYDIKTWLSIKETGVGVKKLQLQFRSHIIDIDIDNCDGVYLIRSLLGMSGAVTKYCLTVGLVRGEKVFKTQYSLPELLVEDSTIDPIDRCFPEAIIYGKEEEANREE